MDVKEPDLSGTYTYADYLTWEWDQLAELIHGKIYKMSPAPSSRHQGISRNLSGQLWQYLRGKECKVFSAPFDVRLPVSSEKKSDRNIVTVVQPDICVICDPSKIDERGCLGSPDWIIEILSKFTSAKDISLKFDVYESSGVKEYWVVHPEEQTLLIYTLDERGKYKGRRKPLTCADTVSCPLFPDLLIDLAEVFEEGEG